MWIKTFFNLKNLDVVFLDLYRESNHCPMSLVCQWYTSLVYPHAYTLPACIAHWSLLLLFTCLFSWSFWKEICFVAEAVMNSNGVVQASLELLILLPQASDFWDRIIPGPRWIWTCIYWVTHDADKVVDVFIVNASFRSFSHLNTELTLMNVKAY